jgi:hypothetical protein
LINFIRINDIDLIICCKIEMFTKLLNVMTKNISITLLTWNDWRNTVECLESIFQNDYKNFDVILINNGSNYHNIKKIYDWADNKIEINDQAIKFNKKKILKFLMLLIQIKKLITNIEIFT